MTKLFGTDGVRGIANRDLTAELALNLGRAAVKMIPGNCTERPTFIIGMDSRISSKMLESALACGMASMGADVLLAGVLPTPGIACLVRNLNLTGGAVISASHNPVEYNGIKFFTGDGFKLTDEMEEKIESIIKAGGIQEDLPVGDKVGRIYERYDSALYYEAYLKEIPGMNFDGIRVAMDCANGAASRIAPDVLADLGVDLVVFNSHPTGTNINVKCGSTYPEFLQEMMKTGRFDAGIAFDGDADRMIAVDETGGIIDGDMMMNMFSRSLLDENKLDNNFLITTVMSNLGLENALKNTGIKMIRADVGDRYVLEEMKKRGAILGGEQSGHIIFLEYNTTGDGIITAIMLLKTMKKTGKKLSELGKMMKVFPQILKNVEVKDKNKIMNAPSFREYLQKKQDETGDRFRILVRPSGTEPLVRVMAEGPDIESTEKLVDEICDRVVEII
ncbi:MAG: phosphoglucosamine mutase [Candidatus Eremiobacteraeota bacterium]|nr:phosphoglucosamine mutase [Candidatus Eremiobacteraeota bacterium]